MAKDKVVDPIDSIFAARESNPEEDMLTLENLSISDLKVIPREMAQSSHPFDGYPIKKQRVQGIDRPINLTHLVALHPNFSVPQDPSGVGYTVRDQKTHQMKTINLETSHGRTVVDYENGRRNVMVIFDRKVKLGDGTELKCAVVPSHSARAQLAFMMNKDKIVPDTRYILIDRDQAKRLRQVFERVNYQITHAEKMARRFDSDPSDQD